LHDAELEQRLLAILAADAAGYSRLMAGDERLTVSALDAARAVFRCCIESNRGRVVDMAGDSVLAVFPTATGAVASALAIQESLGTLEEKLPAERRMRFRVGLHIGDVIEKSDGTVYGDGINIASRLQALAEPGSIVVSDAIRAAVRGRAGVAFVDQGEQAMKNIPQPVRAYSLAAAFGRQQGLPETGYPPGAEPRPVDAGPDRKLRENLPATLTTLFGRADDVAALRELIDQHRLVSIVGPGGIGKTAVAQHLTANTRSNYQHGVCWIELATIANEKDLPAAIASAVGVRIGEGEPLAELCHALKPLVMLVTLDNVEHIVEGVARLVHAVLDHAPGVRFLVTSQAPLKLAVLATSQAPLRLAQEQQYRLLPLSVPATADLVQVRAAGAVQLFEARAGAVRPGFGVSAENASQVSDICRRLDGIPLAIELAVGRLPLLGLEALQTGLAENLRLLPSSLGHSDRHRTLSAALEWSYGLLTSVEQAVFRNLGVFRGSFHLVSARAVCVAAGIEASVVLDTLAAVVDRSLVVAEAGAEPRYRLLVPTREFAAQKLLDAREWNAARDAHLAAMLDLFETAYRCRWTLPLKSRFKCYGQDIDDLRAALAWGLSLEDPEAAIKLAGVAKWLWSPSDQRVEGLEFFRRAISRVGEGTSRAAEARLFLGYAQLAYPERSELETQAVRRATDLYRALGDSTGLCEALLLAAKRQDLSAPEPLGRANYASATALLEEADGLLATDAPIALRIAVMESRAWVAGSPHSSTQPSLLWEECATLSASLGETRDAMRSLMNAAVQSIAGDLDRSIRLLRQVIGLNSDEGELCAMRACAKANLSEALARKGKHGEGLRCMKDAGPGLVAAGLLGPYLDLVALLLLRGGNVVAAAMVLGRANQIFTERGIGREPDAWARDTLIAGLRPVLADNAIQHWVQHGRGLCDSDIIKLLASTPTGLDESS
jgi:predicted ATPase/class 3 adenylate cyclase